MGLCPIRIKLLAQLGHNVKISDLLNHELRSLQKQSAQLVTFYSCESSNYDKCIDVCQLLDSVANNTTRVFHIQRDPSCT